MSDTLTLMRAGFLQTAPCLSNTLVSVTNRKNDQVKKESSMPRKQRHYLPGVPAHIIQRGNNRLPCFFSEDDYQFYMECLRDASNRFGCIIHAYVLMTNHTHLLMTPLYEDAIGKVIQSVGRRYVRYINQTYQRTGTLWEGRHKGNLVQSECYERKKQGSDHSFFLYCKSVFADGARVSVALT